MLFFSSLNSLPLHCEKCHSSFFGFDAVKRQIAYFSKVDVKSNHSDQNPLKSLIPEDSVVFYGGINAAWQANVMVAFVIDL